MSIVLESRRCPLGTNISWMRRRRRRRLRSSSLDLDRAVARSGSGGISRASRQIQITTDQPAGTETQYILAKESVEYQWATARSGPAKLF